MLYKAMMNGKELKEHKIAGHDIVREMLNGRVIWEKNQKIFKFIYKGGYRSVQILMNFAGSRVTVDWGDGTIEEINSNTMENIIHAGEDPDMYYTCTVKGEDFIVFAPPIVGPGGGGSAMTKILTPIPQSGHYAQLEQNSFGGAPLLESIPEDLFYNYPQLQKFTDVFHSTYLKEVPSNLFSKSVEAKTFSRTFSGCGLIRIPEGFFSACTKATYFYETFGNCKYLEEVPENLFDGMQVTSFERCFYWCSKLSKAPKLWEKFPKANGKDCYSVCKSLPWYEEIPDSWK